MSLIDERLIYEIATQLYINKDRIMDMSIQVGSAEFPDLNRQWRVYRDEWLALSSEDRAVWLSRAEDWLSSWILKHGDTHIAYVRENMKFVYSQEN